jgi:hypothetical protein
LPPRKPAKTGSACPIIACGDPGERDPVTTDRQPGQSGHERLERVAEEGRRRAPGTEMVERVPGTRVAVADRSQVHAVPPGDEERDGDRAQEVADEARYHVLQEQCRSSPPST